MTRYQPFPLRVAARDLGVPASWLREQALAGAIPCLRAGSSLLFDLQLVRRILLERARGQMTPVSGNAGPADEGPAALTADGVAVGDPCDEVDDEGRA